MISFQKGYLFNLFDENEDFSLSELDIDGYSCLLLGGGIILSHLHESGYLHKDLHIDHLLIHPTDPGRVGIIDVAFEKTDIEPELIFEDFVAPFISLSKSQFIAVLIGYYKASIFSLDRIRNDFTIDLLLLMGGKTKSLVIPSQLLENRFNLYFDKIGITTTNEDVILTLLENELGFLEKQDEFTFYLFLALIGCVKIDASILEEYAISSFPESKGILDSSKFKDLVNDFNRAIEAPGNKYDNSFINFTLLKFIIKFITNAFDENQLRILSGLMLAFDLLSRKLDHRKIKQDAKLSVNSSSSSLLNKSIVSAQTSLIILQQMSLDARLMESVELTIKTRHYDLSWYSAPRRNWFTSPKPLKNRTIKLSESVTKLEELLKEYEESRGQLRVIGEQKLLNEFQYLNTLVTTLNMIFAKSINEWKDGKNKNILWSCSYRAISYSKRNSYLFVVLLLEKKENNLLFQALMYSVASHIKSIHLYVQGSIEFFSPTILLKGASSQYEKYNSLVNRMKSLQDLLNELSGKEPTRKDEVLLKVKEILYTELEGFFPL